jgi:hypothetical protein
VGGEKHRFQWRWQAGLGGGQHGEQTPGVVLILLGNGDGTFGILWPSRISMATGSQI